MLAELSVSWATGGPDAPLPGYVCIVSKRHVVEPWELPADELTAFWDDAVRTARAIASAVDPVKMNYEIHGNTIPHLHMHLLPRFRGDPYEGQALDGHARFHRSAAELRRLGDAIEAAARTSERLDDVPRTEDDRRPLTVRPAHPADAAGIAEVYVQSAEHHVRLDADFYREPDTGDVEAHYSDRLSSSSDREQIFVATDGPHVLGVVEVALLPVPRAGSMIRPATAVDIGISVREQNRNSGIGARLMTAAEDWARDKGAELATLNMSARNKRALAFYRRLGYEPSGLFLRKRLVRR